MPVEIIIEDKRFSSIGLGIIRVIADHFRRFDEIPDAESIKLDIDRPNKRHKLPFIESILSDLEKIGFVTRPGKHTGRRMSTARGREYFQSIKKESK